MKIKKIFRMVHNQNEQSLQIEREELPDRIRFLLKDEEDNEVGKLTIQFFPYDRENYYLTAFRIDSKYREQGWGKKNDGNGKTR